METLAFLNANGGATPALFQIPSNSKSHYPTLRWPSIVLASAVSKPCAQTSSTPSCESIRADVEAHLKKAIPMKPPLVVFEPMHHLTLAAPRSTASALCIAACELVGGDKEQAMDTAAALHLMHAAAYTHENLPLTDRPEFRPPISHSYGPNIELLTSDGMMPFAFQLIARPDGPARNHSDRVLRVIVEITRATGSQGMVDGQYREVECALSNDQGCSGEDWDFVSEKKEGGLHACAAACGAILGGGSEEEIEKLRKYGFCVGILKGMVKGIGREQERMRMVEEMRNIAIKELEGFDGGKVEEITSFLDANLSYS